MDRRVFHRSSTLRDEWNTVKWNSFRQVRFVRTPKNNTSIWHFFRFDDSLYNKNTVTEKMQFAEISSGIFKITIYCNIWREISLKRIDQIKTCKRTIHLANFGSTTWKTKKNLVVIGTLIITLKNIYLTADCFGFSPTWSDIYYTTWWLS